MRKLSLGVKSRIAMAASALTLAGAGTLAAASPALADYGPTAVYQVELSANISGSQGGGVWLWFELSSDGTGDYQGSDCGHGGAGAVHDSGNVTWSVSNGQVIIKDVVLNGLGGAVATVTAPATYGHYTGTLGSFLTIPGLTLPPAGTSQLQVAP
jgi:hypothetical protein